MRVFKKRELNLKMWFQLVKVVAVEIVGFIMLLLVSTVSSLRIKMLLFSIKQSNENR
jgi:hypothetical protein